MASAPVAPITSLRSYDAERAEAGNAMLRLLNGAGIDVAIINDPALEGAAFRASDAIGFQLAGFGAMDSGIDALCDALDGADALLSHVEGALGINLDPQAFLALAYTAFGKDSALVLKIAQGDQSLHLAIVVEADEVQHWTERASTMPVDLASVPLAVTLNCIAARLPVDDAAGIAAGDLLLLPGTMAAALSVAGGINEQGLYETTQGHWRLGGFADAEDQILDEEDGAEKGGGFTVPVIVRLPEQAVDAATLAALAPGMIVTLSPLVQGLAVDLLVGGRRIAHGEIVQMGDQFAVHIDESFSSSAARADAAPSNEEDD